MSTVALEVSFTATRLDGTTYDVPVRIEGEVSDAGVSGVRAFYATTGDDYGLTYEEIDQAEAALVEHARKFDIIAA